MTNNLPAIPSEQMPPPTLAGGFTPDVKRRLERQTADGSATRSCVNLRPDRAGRYDLVLDNSKATLFSRTVIPYFAIRL